MAELSNVMSQGYRQIETVQLAPDALILINGENTIDDGSGHVFELRNDITEINTSLSTESSPGTASFTISIPDHDSRRAEIIAYRSICVMSEVEIYFRGRFLKKGEPDYYPYYQAFWGVIISITENYNDGVHTISVTCNDILRWWAITNVTINPSLLASTESLKSYIINTLKISKKDCESFLAGNVIKDNNGRSISIFSNNFSMMSIPEILKALSTASLLQMAPVEDFLGYKQEAQIPKGTTAIDKTEIMKYWVDRMNSVGRRLKIYGLTTNKKTGLWELDKDIIGQVLPYQQIPQAPPMMQSERRSQLEIANEIKEAIQFEFYMDVSGEIIFKPPFYNLDVRNNLSSVIDDIDILNWTLVQSESEVLTRIDVKGQLASVSSDGQVVNGIAQNPLLALQFGQRIKAITMPWLNNNDQCLSWAKIELARSQANLKQGTITVLGRPELRLGYPVYVPSRDCFYYIKAIDHHFAFGGTFTTTLTVMAERSKLNKDGTVEIFRRVGEIIKDPSITVSGSTIAEKEENNNFIKQMFLPGMCTPKAQSNAPTEIIEPNFAFDMKQIKKDDTSDWKSFSEIKYTENTVQEFKRTDDGGYEVIGATIPVEVSSYLKKEKQKQGKKTIEDLLQFKYGSDLILNEQGKIIENLSPDTAEKVKQNEVNSAAISAKNLTVENVKLTVDANNIAYTFDNLEARMSQYGSPVSGPKTALKGTSNVP